MSSFVYEFTPEHRALLAIQLPGHSAFIANPDNSIETIAAQIPRQDFYSVNDLPDSLAVALADQIGSVGWFRHFIDTPDGAAQWLSVFPHDRQFFMSMI